MSLPLPEITTYLKGSLDSYTLTPLQDSFGYIRFYVKESDVIVTEIHSELYKLVLTDPVLKKRFKNWALQLWPTFISTPLY